MISIAVEFFEDNGIIRKLYGIRYGEKSFCFTEDITEAENLLCFLAENEVEENHVADIIEDFFYT